MNIKIIFRELILMDKITNPFHYLLQRIIEIQMSFNIKVSTWMTKYFRYSFPIRMIRVTSTPICRYDKFIALNHIKQFYTDIIPTPMMRNLHTINT